VGHERRSKKGVYEQGKQDPGHVSSHMLAWPLDAFHSTLATRLLHSMTGVASLSPVNPLSAGVIHSGLTAD
jgi:hypothetical protein